VSYDGPGSLEQILKCLQVMAVVGGVGGVPAELSCGDFGVLRQDPASARDALARFDAAACALRRLGDEPLFALSADTDVGVAPLASRPCAKTSSLDEVASLPRMVASHDRRDHREMLNGAELRRGASGAVMAQLG